MHMADALLSPAVGGTMWAATAGLAAYAAKKTQRDLDEQKVPLMGVLGAFVFAAQMINFSIPGTGSSGHLGGGLLLAILLGPYAGFLVMASILVIQALFFGDGGLLALGCNIFNLGFYPCFIAYPLLFKPLVKKEITPKRIFGASMSAAIIGLQLGAFSVVLETIFSGISELPFKHFVLLMQPIHLAIGIVEGLITAAVVRFVWKARPEILEKTAVLQPYGNISIKPVLIAFVILALLTGGALSWFASTCPDGLEWSIFHVSGKEELNTSSSVHESLAKIQEKTAFLPDYEFKVSRSKESQAVENKETPEWPAVDAGTSVAGVVGAFMTLVLTVFIGFGLKTLRKHSS